MLTIHQINPASASVELTGLWNRTFGDDPASIYAFYRQFSNHMDVLVQADAIQAEGFADAAAAFAAFDANK